MKVRPLRVALGMALGVGALAAVIALALSLRDIVREVFAGPLGYALYVAGLLWRSVPQGVFLGLLIALGILIALNSLGGRSGEAGLPAAGAPSDDARLSRMRVWTRYLSEFGRSDYAREKMRLEMRALILSALAVLERSTPVEIERRILSGALETPAEVADIVLAGRARAAADGDGALRGRLRRSPLARLAQALRQRMAGRALSDAAAAQQTPMWIRLRAALEWIEAQQYTDAKGRDV